jgi:hypothetical protein
VVGRMSRAETGVARPSQPWAGGLNPFGIGNACKVESVLALWTVGLHESGSKLRALQTLRAVRQRQAWYVSILCSRLLFPAQDIVFVDTFSGRGAEIDHAVGAGGPDHDWRVALEHIRLGRSAEQSVVTGLASLL